MSTQDMVFPLQSHSKRIWNGSWHAYATLALLGSPAVQHLSLWLRNDMKIDRDTLFIPREIQNELNECLFMEGEA